MQNFVSSTNIYTRVVTLLISLLLCWACAVTLEFDTDGCPTFRRVNVTGIEQLFFSPFTNQIPANSSDTVSLESFRLNFELTFQNLTQAYNTTFQMPGIAHAAIDCEPRYQIQNISNIMIILNQPFHGLSVGTDAAFLLSNNDNIQLNRLRDFSESRQFFSFRLNQIIQGNQQLNASLVVTLRDGNVFTQAFVSPVIRN
jgi:hypothetical protein